ncbi:MAG: DUF721 domain-containing protein [Gammaproteobacteria bacterium]|jgi:hypothetical protein
MKYISIHSINALLQNSPTITNIRNKLQQLQQLNKIVAKLLPPTISCHCSVANLRDGILILTTTSPVWNHQINFLKMDLLDKLRISEPAWAGISSILVKTNYLIEELTTYQPDPINNIQNTNNNSKKFFISEKNAEIINGIANNEISYLPLAMALKKLTS